MTIENLIFDKTLTMVYLTRIENFNAAHKLYNEAWSFEKNQAEFGKCANANWHGHNYKLEVTVKGKPDKATGYFINAAELSSIIKREITEVLDHKNLNIDIDWLKGVQPTSEMICISIWKQLSPHLEGKCQLHKLKLVETPNIYVEYYGE